MLSVLEKMGAENDEAPFNKVLKTLEMGPISIKKYEWVFAIMVPLSTTKHKMTYWDSDIFIILGLYSWVQNNCLFTRHS